MRIAIDAVGIRDGGGAAVLYELLHWLPRVRPEWRWHVFLLARSLRQFDDPPVAAPSVIESTRCGHSGLGRLRWVYFQLPRRLEAIGADAVLSFANIGSSAPRVPQVTFCQQPLVLSRDGHDQYSLWDRFRLEVQSILVRRGARASSSIIVQTQWMCERFLQLEPSLDQRLRVIPSGYRSPPATSVIGPEKRALIDSAGRPRLLYVSLLRPHKNHAVLIPALARIVESYPEARLLLTVDPATPLYPQMAQLLQHFKQTIRELGVEKNIVWLGQLTPDEVSYAFAKSDLMVFPSLAESFGLPLAEAMAAGCPIVAADLPYAHDVAGPAALYFDPQNSSQLADCVLQALGDPATLAGLRSAAATRRPRFSYETIAEQFAVQLAASIRSRSDSLTFAI